MRLGTWISIGLALTFAAVAPACDKGNDARLQGAAGAEDAATQLNAFMCECLDEQGEENICEDEALLEEAMDAVDYDCFQRVLDQHPDERSTVQCLVNASYDLLECFEASGCPEVIVVEAAPEPGIDPDGNPPLEEEEPPEPTAADRCLEDFEDNIEACPEPSAAFEEQLEDECFGARQTEVCGPTEDCE